MSESLKELSSKCRCCRIVLTGGPGGGKTTAADLFRRELGERVVIVPEAATLLYSGGFPRSKNPNAARVTQHAIYHLQQHIEGVYQQLYPNRILLCDRGTVDGACYWPDGSESFFSSVKSSIEEQFKRYDAVIFFETAAVGGIRIEGGNPIRNETIEEAKQLDAKLKALWSQHHRYTLVAHESSFFKKMTCALGTLRTVVENLVGQMG